MFQNLEALYSALSFAMRYWFLFLILLIVIALIWVSVSEYRQRKFVMNQIGAFVGYMDIIDGPEEIVGQRIGLTNDNSIGSSRRADIWIEDPSISKTHALIYARDGHMYMSPMQNSATQINGRRASKVHEIYTGDTVTLGDVTVEIYIKGDDLQGGN